MEIPLVEETLIRYTESRWAYKYLIDNVMYLFMSQ
jgi:hypothetical protein